MKKRTLKMFGQKITRGLASAAHFKVWLILLAGFAAGQVNAATATIYANDFEAYSSVAASLADEADADPVGAEWNISDDAALIPTTAGAGVQVINWLAQAGSKSLLLRPSSEAQVSLNNTKSGKSYQLDFWLYSDRGPTSSHNFYIVLQGMGSDNNGGDFLAYRGGRATNDVALVCYDGVRATPGWASVGANHLTGVWQHHRIVFDPNVPSLTVYVGDMVNPLLVNSGTARSEVPMPTRLRIINEGNSADDGYFAIDGLSLTVEDSISLATTFAEGFESYPARVTPADDADPKGPWITTETDGTVAAGGRPLAPDKVQVVGSTVVTPHSGNNCLKIEAGQRAGATIAWGVSPQSDVQITWWARVPESVDGTVGNYLRMSLYGAEGGNSYSGDCALLGYGSRDATIGDATSLTYFTTAWVDTTIDYTPGVWEQYQMTTHNNQGQYTVLKNPSGANPEVIVDRAAFIGSAANWGPTFMAAWSSSNGTNHPPVYIDDIEIKSIVSNPDPLPNPYSVQFNGTRLTNVTIISLIGPVGAVAVDPRDNSTIVFTLDAATGGGIYKATKVAAGNWSVDSTPLVAGLSNPSGITIATDGTIWWTHDFTAALMRLKAPWSANSPELVISDFILPGATTFGLDDDTFDLRFAPASFNGTLGKPFHLVLMDRGVDDNPWNTLFLVDPATAQLNQVNFDDYLYGPTTTGLGGGDLVGMTTLPATGEIVTLNFDGQVTAVNADGSARSFWPDFYSDPFTPIAPASIATDPLTGRLWITDDLTNQVWSCAPDGTSGQRELSFPLTNPERPERQIDFQEPGMGFAPDGSLMVLSDTSTVNGGGRLIIFHNEVISLPSYSISTVTRVAQGIQLVWQSAGSARYDVLRSTDVANAAGFQTIATNLISAQFTDTNAPAGAAFYRVIARP